jgi:iron complex outermembrane receptor protein
VNSQTNRGIDLTAQYRHEFSFGEFGIQAQASYQLEDVTALFEGTQQDFNGTEGEPKLVGNVDFSLERGPWTVFWRVNYIGDTNDDSITQPTDGVDTRFVINADAIWYHTLSVRRDFGAWQLLGGVANLFDQEPPRVSTVGGAGQAFIGPSLLTSNYDYIGRRFFMRLSAQF